MEKIMAKQSSENLPRKEVWDCGSSLYDSFELKSFEKQLDSAIASRTLSMPHLSDHRGGLPLQPSENKKHTSKLSRSFHRLIRSVFGHKVNNNNINNFGGKEGFYVGSAALSTIPEVPEFDGLSPEIRSLVGRTASDRFTSVGIYCV